MNRLIRILSIFVLGLWSHSCLAQFSFGQFETYNSPVYFAVDSVLEWHDYYLTEAKKGNVEAMFQLGMYYVENSEYNKAKPWLMKAYKKNYAQAATALGWMEYLQDSIGKGLDNAMVWFENAGEEPQALFNLSAIYMKPSTHYYNLEKAKRFLQKAAEFNNPQSLYNLGVMNLQGLYGFPKDSVQAFSYIKKAAALIPEKAAATLSLCYYNGIGCERNLNQGLYWAQLGADHGNPSCLHVLGCLHYYGHQFEMNQKLGYQMVCKADSMGAPDAKCGMGMMEILGIEGRHDYVHGALHLKPFLNKGIPEVEAIYARAFMSNEQVPADYPLAMKYSRMSADKMEFFGLQNMFNIYRKGLGVNKNLDSMKVYARKMVQQYPDDYENRMYLISHTWDFCLEQTHDERIDTAFIEELTMPGVKAKKIEAYNVIIHFRIDQNRWSEARKMLNELMELVPKDNQEENKICQNFYSMLLNHLMKHPTPKNIQAILQEANRGNMTAQEIIGSHYYRKKNYALARKYYKMAAAQGSTKAKDDLEYLNECGF